MRAIFTIALLAASSSSALADPTITNLQVGQLIPHTAGTCSIPLVGAVGGGTHTIEARASQGSLTWTTVQSSATTTYSGTLSVPVGDHVISVRLADAPNTRGTISYIACGILLHVDTSQSNAVGQGDNLQTYAPPQGALPHARYYGGDYLWHYSLSDPLGICGVGTNACWVDAVTSNGTTAGGSVWILVANYLSTHATARKYPVAFIPCGVNGTGIVSWNPGADHSDRTTQYGACNYRAHQASTTGTVSAVVRWQGETDVQGGMVAATYTGHLQTQGDAVFADLGAPTIVAKLQNTFGGNNTEVNNGIVAAIGGHHVVAGPDLSAIPTDDDWHLRSNGHLATAGTAWGAAIVTALSL